MWSVENETRFAADGQVLIDKAGERHWVVVVRGTFDILPDGRTVPADEQPPPLHSPQYRGELGSSSIIYEQDFTLPKPRTDIIVNGSAYAPHGRPATEVIVGMKTPSTVKSLRVLGNRIYTPLGLSDPKPFVSMPIVYENAFGGWDQQDPNPKYHRLDPRNPVGRGMHTKTSHRFGQPAPNVEFVGQSVDSGPAGFGAVCSYWEPRVSYQGSYDAAWVASKKPLLPDDWDPQVLQFAPRDQQVSPHLRGGEPIGLHNLVPAGTLEVRVPKHYFGFSTRFDGPIRGDKEHRAKLHSVIIEPDDARLIVVWHSMLSCHHQIDDISETLVTEKEYI